MDCYLVTPVEHALDRLHGLIERNVVTLGATVLTGDCRFAEGRREWATPALYIVNAGEQNPQKWQVLLYQADRQRVLDLGYPPDDEDVVRLPYPSPFFYTLEWRDKRQGAPRAIELATAMLDAFGALEMRVAPEPDQLYDIPQFIRLLSGQDALGS